MLLMTGNNMNEKLVKLLVEEKALVKLLKTVGEGSYHTRELLGIIGEWGYGHKLLVKAHRLGLVDRERIKRDGRGNWRIYNKLSKKGREVIRLAEQIGV